MSAAHTPLLTTAQVAERLGITPRRVVALIKAKRLPAKRFGHSWAIQESDLGKVAERPTGRPKEISMTGTMAALIEAYPELGEQLRAQCPVIERGGDAAVTLRRHVNAGEKILAENHELSRAHILREEDGTPVFQLRLLPW